MSTSGGEILRSSFTMKDFAESFYKGPAWKACRAAYVKSVGGLCEACLARGIYRAGEIVHHKVHITPETINDPTVTLSFDNLELLCRDCHAEMHEKRRKRYKIDEWGRVQVRGDPPL